MPADTGGEYKLCPSDPAAIRAHGTPDGAAANCAMLCRSMRRAFTLPPPDGGESGSNHLGDGAHATLTGL
jgi:hypothetical protein